MKIKTKGGKHYTIPRNNRELQRDFVIGVIVDDYTIPRNNRELQLLSVIVILLIIIPYQEIIGNYSLQ